MPVGFNDGVEKVQQNDTGLDTTIVLGPLTASSRRLWLTSTNPYGVVRRLYPARDELAKSIVVMWYELEDRCVKAMKVRKQERVD